MPQSTPPQERSTVELLKLLRLLVADFGETDPSDAWFWDDVRRSVDKNSLPDLTEMREEGIRPIAFKGPGYQRLRQLLFDLVKIHPEGRRLVGYCLSLWTELGVIPRADFSPGLIYSSK